MTTPAAETTSPKAPEQKSNWIGFVAVLVVVFLAVKFIWPRITGAADSVAQSCMGVIRSGGPQGQDKVFNTCSFPVNAVVCLDGQCPRAKTFYPGDTYAHLAGEG